MGENIIHKSEEACCGCSACVSICPQNAIYLLTNPNGFDIPVIDNQKCIQCGLCDKVCRFAKNASSVEKIHSRIFSFKLKKERLFCQSGGAAFALSKSILSINGIVYGVGYDSEKCEALYCRIDNDKDLKKLRGSKYIQTKTNGVISLIREDLISGEDVLVLGTPCFIDGLLSYLKIQKINLDKLLTCDLICHGVPSPKIFRDYICYLEEKFKNVKMFNFRNKRLSGWHGHVESFRINRIKSCKSHNFVKIFYSNVCLRQSCYNCNYASERRVSDITIGDFWGIEKYNQRIDDDLGVSVVLSNSHKGELLVEKMSQYGEVKQITAENYTQPNMIAPTPRSVDYNDFWHMYYENGLIMAVKKYCSFDENDYTYYYQFYETYRVIRKKISHIIKLMSKYVKKW